MSTYRDRREARAARLREWAEKRQQKSDALHEQARARADLIPFGQPILVGHHSERTDRNNRDRIHRTFERAFEHATKADDMTRRADSIEAQSAHAIYSDDPNAIDRLRDRLAELEAERDRITAYNASCRKAAKTGGTGDLALLDEKQRENVATLLRVAPYQLRPGNALPAYALSNLSGNIKRNRDRLAELERKAAE